MTNPFAPPPAPEPGGHPGPSYQQPAWTPPAPPRSGTNGWAVASLVTGLTCLFFAAIPTGIVGLVQTRRHQQAGWGLALAGVILGGVVGTAFVALVTAGLLGAFDEDPLGPLRDVPTTSVGTCLREGEPWEITDCSSRHDAEVYFSDDVAGSGYPGTTALYDEASDLCYTAFEDYTGESYDDSDYDYEFFQPDEAEWLAGRRTVVCVLTPFVDDSLVGSGAG